MMPWSGQGQQVNTCVTSTIVKGMINGMAAENISINGATNNISMYHIPATFDLDPQSNTAFINLTGDKNSHISTIIKKNGVDDQKQLRKYLTYNGKKYCVVEIIFDIDGKQESKEYLIPYDSYICYTDASTKIISKITMDAFESCEIQYETK